ncbi:MAG: LD-carboxypeptidase [Pseudomonadota bacterium]
MSRTIRVIKPAGREKVPDFLARLERLREAGFSVFYDETPEEASWSYTSGSISDRARELNSALKSASPDVLLAARGGYGSSDLLELVDWESLKVLPEKTIVGFSDISALLSAVYTRLGWRGIHGPMPGSSLWEWGPDVTLLLDVLKGQKTEFQFEVKSLKHAHSNVSGELFGGCFSVLTSLIGTPFFPLSLSGKILFLEDIGENPGRLMRFWNQWIQSGATQGIKGVLLGHFSGVGEPSESHCQIFFEEFAKRANVPVWHTSAFGHKQENYPMPMGAPIKLTGSTATWKL